MVFNATFNNISVISLTIYMYVKYVLLLVLLVKD